MLKRWLDTSSWCCGLRWALASFAWSQKSLNFDVTEPVILTPSPSLLGLNLCLLGFLTLVGYKLRLKKLHLFQGPSSFHALDQIPRELARKSNGGSRRREGRGTFMASLYLRLRKYARVFSPPLLHTYTDLCSNTSFTILWLCELGQQLVNFSGQPTF